MTQQTDKNKTTGCTTGAATPSVTPLPDSIPGNEATSHSKITGTKDCHETSPHCKSSDLHAYKAMLSELKESLSRELSDLIRDEFRAVAGAQSTPGATAEATPASLAPTRAETPEEAYLRGRNEAIAERWEGLRGFPAEAPSAEPTIKRRPSVWDSES